MRLFPLHLRSLPAPLAYLHHAGHVRDAPAPCSADVEAQEAGWGGGGDRDKQPGSSS